MPEKESCRNMRRKRWRTKVLLWKAHNPNYGANHKDYHGYLESTGTAMTWCQNIRLFAAAARLAGPNLTRTGFDAAMARLSSFPGTVVPELNYGSGKAWGPRQSRAVQVHKNDDGKWVEGGTLERKAS